MNHVNITKTQPAGYQAMLELHKVTSKAAAEAGIDPKLVELIKIRASQINGCAYCLRMHVADAVKLGETTDRLAVLSAWRETTGYFSAAEIAALEITEYVTLISTAELSEEVRARIGVALSEEQIGAVHWLAIVINALNRLAISSHYLVAPSP